MLCQGLLEFLWRGNTLGPLEEDYRFAPRIYESINPTNAADILLWHRLDAKTMATVDEHLVDVTISREELEQVAMDAGALKALKGLKLFDHYGPMPKPVSTALGVLARLEERIA